MTLYGVLAGERNAFTKLYGKLLENGWYDHDSRTVEHVRGPQGEDLTRTESWYHMTGVDLYDLTLLVYHTSDDKILYWLMTNEGMATMDNAVDQAVLGYVFPQ